MYTSRTGVGTGLGTITPFQITDENYQPSQKSQHLVDYNNNISNSRKAIVI